MRYMVEEMLDYIQGMMLVHSGLIIVVDIKDRNGGFE